MLPPTIYVLRGPATAGAPAGARASTSRSAPAAAAAPLPLRCQRAVRASAAGRSIDLGEDAAFADVPRLTSGGRAREQRLRRVYRSFEDEEGADADAAPSSSAVLGPDGLPFDVPKSAYGLTLRQMGALGLAGEGGPGLRSRGVDPVSSLEGTEAEGKTPRRWRRAAEKKTSGFDPSGRARHEPSLGRVQFADGTPARPTGG